MEDSKEKLELMLECYLGKWHPLCPDGSVKFQEYGFANQYVPLTADAKIVLHKGNNSKAAQKMRRRYQRVKAAYDSLPFDKLDENDLELFTIYKTRDLIVDLGQAIDDFLHEPDSCGYEKMDEIVIKMVDADVPSFEDKIKELAKSLKVHIGFIS